MQEFGLNLLIRQETIDRASAEDTALRNALIASGTKPGLVYPDIFGDPNPVEEADLEQDPHALFRDDVEYDYSGVEQLDPAHFERDQAALLATLMETDHMVMTENPDGL